MGIDNGFFNLVETLDILEKFFELKFRNMEIITLESTSIKDLTACFNEAFSDYFIKFNATEFYLAERWKGAGIDFSLSAGVLDGNQLVGFIMIGIRDWQGHKTAFNAGTGVIPSHRGNKLTERMYDFLIPKFKENEVKAMSLEVIQENVKAIHVYEKVGLKIDRGLNCFKGAITIEGTEQGQDMSFQETDTPQWDFMQSCYSIEPAWESNNLALQACSDLYAFFEVKKENELIGFINIRKDNGDIKQFGVHPNYRNQGVGKFMFFQVAKKYPEVKLNNVDDSAPEVLSFLDRVGLHNVINQYEMVSYL